MEWLADPNAWVALSALTALEIMSGVDSIILIPIMAIAIVLATGVMMFAAGSIGRFVGRHPAVRMPALSFLIIVGIALIAEGLAFHIPRGYICFAMAFSVAVELLNIRVRAKRERASTR